MLFRSRNVSFRSFCSILFSASLVLAVFQSQLHRKIIPCETCETRHFSTAYVSPENTEQESRTLQLASFRKKPPYHNRKPEKCRGKEWQVSSPVHEKVYKTIFRINHFGGTFDGPMKAQMLAHGGTLKPNGFVALDYWYREVQTVRIYYTDFWRCKNGKPKFVRTLKYTRLGLSTEYKQPALAGFLGGATPQWIPPLTEKPSAVSVSSESD